jgi:hypothetical protein
MFSLKITTAIIYLSFALPLALQTDSCERQGGRAPKASQSPRAESTPRANGRDGGKAKGNDPVKIFLTSGEWGGDHISFTVTEKGASIEYDCAHGTIDQRLELDADGRFDVRGMHEDETGGSPPEISIADEGDKTSPPGASALRHPARYTGRVEGRTLSLTVTLADGGRTFGEFVLAQGASPRLNKCR